MDTIHGVDAALMNKGIKSVTLRTKQNKPTQRLFFSSGKQKKCSERSRGKYNTQHSGLYRFIAHFEKARNTNNFNFPLDFYQYIYFEFIVEFEV